MGIFDRGGSNDDLLVVTELINNAEGESVTKKNLIGRQIGGDPALSYIQDGERPHYILYNRSKGITYNERGEKNTVKPSNSSCALGIFTDQRILFLTGSDDEADQRIVSYDDVKSVEASTGVIKNKLVLRTLYSNYHFPVSGSITQKEFENSVMFVRRQSGLGKSETTSTVREAPTGTVIDTVPIDDRDKQGILQRLRRMDPYDFEYFVADLWEAQGWNTTVSQASVDQGVDIIATKENPFPQKQVIQAKRYAESNTIGSPKIQQYASLRQQEQGADVSVIVTTSGFSRQAEKLAQNLNVKLVDADGIYQLLGETERFDLVSNYAPTAVELEAEPTEAQKPNIPQNKDDIGEDISAPRTPSETASESKNGSFFKSYRECPSCGEFVGMKRTWRKDLVFPKLQCTQCWTINHEEDDELKPLPEFRSERDQNASKYGYYGVSSAVVVAVLSVGVPALALISWIVLTIAVSRDTRYVRSNSERNPPTGYWVWGAAILPIVGIGALGGIGAGLSLLIVGGAYLTQRYRNDISESNIHQGGIRAFITKKRS